MAKTLKVARAFPAPGNHLCGLAWDGQNLWHSDADTDLLYCLDPHSGAILRTLDCADVRTGPDYQSGLLWQVAGHPKRTCNLQPSNLQPFNLNLQSPTSPSSHPGKVSGTSQPSPLTILLL